MKQEIISTGAESVIYKKDKIINKKRIKKSYRISELDDKIRKLRTRSEAKILEKVGKVVNVPKVLKSQETSKEIFMEFIDGKKISTSLDKFSLKQQKEVVRRIGEGVTKLHDVNIIHGDLTTSNMIWKNNEIYFIDFGLGFYSTKIEDRAVDLYLFKQALEAKHFENFEILFKEFLEYYKPKNKDKILTQLKKVEKRRRYK